MRCAAILAGGRATRFGGRNKGALLVDGRPIVDRQIDELAALSTLDEILIVGGTSPHPRARVIDDVVPGSGPLGGIHAALYTLADADDAAFVVACDMPFVTRQLVDALLNLSHGVDIVVPVTERGYHPLCAVYRRTCLEPIETRLTQRRLKVMDLFDEMRTRVVTGEELDRIGDRHRMLANVNTPSDYQALQEYQNHQL